MNNLHQKNNFKNNNEASEVSPIGGDLEGAEGAFNKVGLGRHPGPFLIRTL